MYVVLLKSLQDVSCQVHNSLSRLSCTLCVKIRGKIHSNRGINKISQLFTGGYQRKKATVFLAKIFILISGYPILFFKTILP